MASSRREFLGFGGVAALGALGVRPALDDAPDLERAMGGMEAIAGVDLGDEWRARLRQEVERNRDGFVDRRSRPFQYVDPPAHTFVPEGQWFRSTPPTLQPTEVGRSPAREADVAFASIRQLRGWLDSGAITSVELTRLYLDRLKRHGPNLRCVITLTEEIALAQASRADERIQSGESSPLLGIPYGVKDLFATRGAPTTWGTEFYRDQTFDEDAHVVTKLQRAGAVMVAKLSLGELAYNDVWFGGQTLNPWNLEQGSSGSSAGSASATAAGLVGFSIGTETLGSIVSPSIRCRVAGLRPTFGTVGRSGGMVLSWSLDKAGPICRTAEDASIVLAEITGPDRQDRATLLSGLRQELRPEAPTEPRIGIVEGSDPNRSTDDLSALLSNAGLATTGATLEPPAFDPAFYLVINVEPAAAFEAFMEGEGIELMQEGSIWPSELRLARYVPAVEYLQLDRLRWKLMREMEASFERADVWAGWNWGGLLAHSNFTGHPQVVVPVDEGLSVSLVGRLGADHQLAALAHKIQVAGATFGTRPEGFS